MPKQNTDTRVTAQPSQVRAALNEMARDICLLVMGKDTPPAEAFAAMTTQEVTEAENWASLTHLAASDCIVVLPPRPAILDKGASS